MRGNPSKERGPPRLTRTGHMPVLARRPASPSLVSGPRYRTPRCLPGPREAVPAAFAGGTRVFVRPFTLRWLSLNLTPYVRV